VSLLYRTRQFWFALTAIPAEDDLVHAGQALSPELMALFRRMQPGEQAHSLAIFRQLREDGEIDRDLWVAALLHDVGKSCHPLRLWERVLIVVANRLLPELARRWGQGEPVGWRRAFVVACKHPEWGAQMAAAADASPQAVELIRRHQDNIALNTAAGEFVQLLYRLQSLDNER
jgi:putative nucleotidyltransferase with HDIG domain